MARSRREFLTRATLLSATGGTLLPLTASADTDEDVDAMTEMRFQVYPIGRVEINGESTAIRIFDKYVDGLLGLEEWSHVNVFYWFDKNDTPERRSILQVHPRGDGENPLTGVFACRAPVRPNLIALSVCRILAVEQNLLTIERIDAFDETPVLDLKPFIPLDAVSKDLKVPEWTGRIRREQ